MNFLSVWIFCNVYTINTITTTHSADGLQRALTARRWNRSWNQATSHIPHRTSHIPGLRLTPIARRMTRRTKQARCWERERTAGPFHRLVSVWAMTARSSGWCCGLSPPELPLFVLMAICFLSLLGALGGWGLRGNMPTIYIYEYLCWGSGGWAVWPSGEALGW